LTHDGQKCTTQKSHMLKVTVIREIKIKNATETEKSE